MGELAGPRHVIRHPGVAGKVQIDVLLRLVPAQTQLFGQTKSRHSVDEAEIDRLRLATLVPGDITNLDPEYFGSGGTVHVQLIGKGIEQSLVLRKVRHDAQLDL